MAKISGVAAASVAAGLLFAYAGLTGKDIPAAIQSIISGKNPKNLTAKYPVSGSGIAVATPSQHASVSAQGGQPGGSAKANQALGRLMAASYGWGSGDQWTSLNNIVMAESGWSDTVTNSGSGAAGIAQNISGFGPGYESGNAAQQITWLLRYIKSRYGDPIAAWRFHLANGWY